jgi:glycine cleavage system aminomethyltransferase T
MSSTTTPVIGQLRQRMIEDMNARKDLALALLPLHLTSPGIKLEVPVLGDRCAAEVVGESPYDPDNRRLRM